MRRDDAQKVFSQLHTRLRLYQPHILLFSMSPLLSPSSKLFFFLICLFDFFFFGRHPLFFAWEKHHLVISGVIEERDSVAHLF